MTNYEKVLYSLASCSRTNGDKCEGCSYVNYHDCAENLASDAYDLIKSQHDEIIKLQSEE